MMLTIDPRLGELIRANQGPDWLEKLESPSVVRAFEYYDVTFEVTCGTTSLATITLTANTADARVGVLELREYNSGTPSTDEGEYYFIWDDARELLRRAALDDPTDDPDDADEDDEELQQQLEYAENEAEEYVLSEYALINRELPQAAVSWSSVSNSHRGLGVGRALYELAWYVTSFAHIYMLSDSTRSGFAERMWQGFERRGVAYPLLDQDEGAFYKNPHDLYQDDIHAVARNLYLWEWAPEVAEAHAQWSELDDANDAAIEVYNAAEEAYMDNEDDDLEDELEEARDAAEAAQEATEEALREYELEFLAVINDAVHSRNKHAVYPECDWGGCETLPPGSPEEFGVSEYDVIEYAEGWPVYRYVMMPVQYTNVTGLAGLFGLGQPELPEDIDEIGYGSET